MSNRFCFGHFLISARYTVADASAVRDFIARTWLGRDGLTHQLGSVRLHESQHEAVARIAAAIAEFGGALLCDEVGMGKTFTALAVIAGSRNPLIVAPASLRDMWTESLKRAQVRAEFVSIEQLSRGSAPGGHDVIIVDEAHHFRNRKTFRYASLTARAGDASIVLMTATPVHNRREDLFVLLSLFLGAGASGLTEEEIGRCLIRRTKQISNSPGAPRIEYRERFVTSHDTRLLRLLVELPPTAPLRGGGVADSLVVQGLIRQWASTDAALEAALLRRIHLALALLSALEVGRYPTSAEMRAWIAPEETLQFGFPELLASKTSGTTSLTNAVIQHRDALFRAYDMVREPGRAVDSQRADIIHSICARHAGERVIVFSQFAHSVRAMYGRLKSTGGVAALTARGGIIASGSIPRSDVLSQFDPQATKTATAQAIRLLLTTDLASEGVNLQEATAVIHLDLPWTHARLEQRVGRAARMGSPHPRVSVYTIEPPESAAKWLDTRARILRKHWVATASVGWTQPAIAGSESTRTSTNRSAAPDSVEVIAAAFRSWIAATPSAVFSNDTVIAAVESSHREGFLALLTTEYGPLLLSRLRAEGCTSEIEKVIECVNECTGGPGRFDQLAASSALEYCEEWISQKTLGQTAGVQQSSTQFRRRSLSQLSCAWANLSSRRRVEVMSDFRMARALLSSRMTAGREEEVDRILRTTGNADLGSSLAALARQSSVSRSPSARSKVMAVILFAPASAVTGSGDS